MLLLTDELKKINHSIEENKIENNENSFIKKKLSREEKKRILERTILEGDFTDEKYKNYGFTRSETLDDRF